MKNIIKLSLAIALLPLLCTGAERPDSNDQNVWERILANPEVMIQKQREIQEQAAKEFATSVAKDYIAAGQPVPAKILRKADSETAVLAYQHNHNLQQQLQNQDQK